jgi:hypothetical protein
MLSRPPWPLYLFLLFLLYRNPALTFKRFFGDLFNVASRVQHRKDLLETKVSSTRNTWKEEQEQG